MLVGRAGSGENYPGIDHCIECSSAASPPQAICVPMQSRMKEIGRCTPAMACTGTIRLSLGAYA